MSLSELRSELALRSTREDTFWDYLRRMKAEERQLFFRLARNRPRQGAPITDPERSGFVRIADARKDPSLVEACVFDAPYVDDTSRGREFQSAIELVHKLAPNFTLYIGRSYVRRHSEHLGPRQRWLAHQDDRRMQFAMVLARVPRGRVERDEELAIALVKCWADYDALCCNNDAMSGRQSLSDDPEQLLYVCVRRRYG
jgi:hypothetical protein